MAECKHCNQCMHYKPRPSADGLLHFEMAPRPFRQTAVQQWPVREPQPPVQLGAGEKIHRSFSWRDDVWGYLCFSGVYAVLVPGATWCFINAFGSDDWDVWAMSGLSIAILVAGFTRLRWDVWKRDKDALRPITQTRAPEQPQPQAGGTWHAESVVKAGNTTTYDRPELSDPWAWHRFCKAVVTKKREFSQSESRRHKVPPSDWSTVYDSWVSRGWLVPQGWRKAPRVKGQAMAHIRNYANTPPTMEE